MAPPLSDRIKLVTVGTLATGEIFNWSVWTSIDTSGAPTTTQVQNLSSDVATWFTANAFGATGLTQLLQNDSSYTQIKAYYYGAGQATSSIVGISSIGGGTGARTLTLPLQTAMCVSLKTNFAGRSNRGRVYLPASGVPLTSHRFDNTELGYARDKLVAYLSWINTTATVGTRTLTAIVNSNTTGQHEPIVSVAVDNRPDVQRRRANRLTATSTLTGVVTP